MFVNTARSSARDMEKDPTDIDRWHNYSTRSEFRKGKLIRWICPIWQSGLQIGRRVVITGVVVSAMPLVVPPLVALSTVGVALSVPFGVMYVGYTATDKLLSTLLPEPEPPPNLWLRRRAVYSDVGYDNDEFAQKEGLVAAGAEKDGYDPCDLQEEEKEWENNVRREVEVRIELPESEGGYIKEVRTRGHRGRPNLGQDDGKRRETTSKMIEKEECREDIDPLGKMEKDGRDLGAFKSEMIESEKYPEDVDQYAERESRASSVREILKGIEEAEDEISAMKEGVDQQLPEDSVRAFIVSAELGGKGDSDVQEVEELVAVEPEAKTELSTRPDEVKFGDVEPEPSARPEVKFGDVEPEVRIRQSAGPKVKFGDVEPEVRMRHEVGPELKHGYVESKDQIEESSRPEVKLGDVEPEVNMEKIARSEVELGDLDQEVKIDQYPLPEVKFGDVEPMELKEETTGILKAIRDEGRAEEKALVESPDASDVHVAAASLDGEIVQELREAEEEIPSMEGGIDYQKSEDPVHASIVAADLEGNGVSDVAAGPEVVIEQKSAWSEVRFGDVQKEELREETTSMLEVIRDKGKAEDERQVSEKTSVDAAYAREKLAGSVREIIKEIKRAEDQISSKEGGKDYQMPEDSVSASIVSAKLGGVKDSAGEEVEEVVAVGLEVITEQESAQPEVQFGDVEPGELREEITGILEAIRDEVKAENASYIAAPTEEESSEAFYVHEPAADSDIGIRGSEGGISSMEEGTDHRTTEDSVHASVVIVEFIGKGDSDVEKVEEVIAVEPGIIIEQERSVPVVQFGDVEPEELRKETTGILEAIRDEGEAEKEIQTDFSNVERMKQPANKTGKGSSVFGGGSSGLVYMLDGNEEEKQLEVSSEEMGNLGETSTIHIGAEPMGDVMVSTGVVLVEEKEDLSVVQQGGQHLVENRLVVHVQRKSGATEPVVEKKRLVVHVRKSGDHIASDIRTESETSAGGESLSITRIDEQETASGGRLNLVAGESIRVTSGEAAKTRQDADEGFPKSASLPETAVSIPVEVLHDQQKIWEQINALRTIIGYKETLKSSYMEELQALYLFTGVEPFESARDGSYSSSNSIVDVNEKIKFLMNIIGVE